MRRNAVWPIVGVIAAAGAVALRGWYLRWGATSEEVAKGLPGAARGLTPASTRAITIHAPAGEVWRWLVQIGQDRGGFYSYSFLENLVRADIHNVDSIVPEWQDLQEGDHVRLASKKVYGDRPLLKVTHLEPNRHIVLEHWGAFVIEPIDVGSCRLILRTYREDKPLAGTVMDAVMEFPHFIMERKMMLGIKSRAERGARLLAVSS